VFPQYCYLDKCFLVVITFLPYFIHYIVPPYLSAPVTTVLLAVGTRNAVMKDPHHFGLSDGQ
jgi:hypothetical protein